MCVKYMLYHGLIVSDGDYSKTSFDVVDVYMNLNMYCDIVDLKTGLVGGLKLTLTWLDFDNVEYNTLLELLLIVIGREKLRNILQFDKEDRLRFICFSIKTLNVLNRD